MITHDLGVVAELADDVMVMYAGRAVEHGGRGDVFDRPRAPLHLGPARLDAAAGPGPHRAAAPIPGTPPSLIACRRAAPSTRAAPTAQVTGGRLPSTEVPELREIGPGHRSALPPATGQRQAARERIRRLGPSVDGRRAATAEGAGQMSAPAQAGATGPSEPRAAAPPPADRRLLLRVTGPDASTSRSRRGSLRRQGRRRAGRRRRRLRRARGRDARPGRRVRLRQDHDRAAAHPAADEPTGGKIEFEGQRHHAPGRGRDAPAAPRHADDLPGPLLLAQPAAHGRHDRRRAAAAAARATEPGVEARRSRSCWSWSA